MKKWLVWLSLLLLPMQAIARVGTARLVTSTTNLGTSFGSSGGLISLPVFTSADTIMIDNQSTGEIAVNCSVGNYNTPPSDTSANNIYVQSKEAWVLPDLAGLQPYCYWRSMTGSVISSGTIVVTIVGR